MTSLNTVYTIGNQIMEAVLLHTDKKKAEARERAKELLELVGINEPEKRLKQYDESIEKERSNVMLTREYVSLRLQQYKDGEKISLETMAARLDLPKSSLHEYLKGRGNLRSDTIDLIVGKIGITVPEMFSDPSPSYSQAAHLVQAAGVLGGLPAAQREQGLQLFLAMVALFS